MSYNSLRTSKNINKTKFIRLMKTFRLLIVALLLAGSASAQRYERRAMRGEYSPTVYLISVQEVDTIYNYGPYAMQQAAALNRMAMDNATQEDTTTEDTTTEDTATEDTTTEIGRASCRERV